MDDTLSRPTPSPSERRSLIAAQADRFAQVLGVDPEAIAVDYSHGVSLTPRQADRLLEMLERPAAEPET